MHRLRNIVKSGFLSGLVVLLALIHPATLMAEGTPPTDDSSSVPCIAPPANTPGVSRPVGADAKTFTYNCDSELWENDHYSFNPRTKQTIAKDAAIYTYNASTGKWDTTTWLYNAPAGTYFAVTNSVAQPPAGATKVGGPAPVVSPSGGASSQATVSNGVATSMSATNNAASYASTGNASVIANTTAGGASTGNASAMVNMMNLLQSNSTAFGPDGNAITFVTDINGDVNGDFLLDPAQLSAVQPAADTGQTNPQTKINSSTDAEMTNDVTVQAQSGDATVAQNTTAGDATTGSAKAVANIVNIINSAVTSGKSFLGVVNINGNLNGDILLPADFVDQLLASNVPTTSVDAARLFEQNTSSSIANNVSATASTGNANTTANTTAGSATTGDASSNITTFNLTGSNVIGKNSLLVFVNVLGEWVGLIVNAPAGATAAQLGGGVSSNTTNPDGANSTNAKITNNVDVGAQSGNADVSQNTTAGSATSGDADAAVNLLNITSSTMSFADWLGVLFINVFGTWNGSFGVNTSAGDPAAQTPEGVVQGQVRVVQFSPTPQTTIQTNASQPSQPAVVTASNDDTDTTQAALGAETDTPKIAGGLESQALPNWVIPVLGSGLMGALLLLGEAISKRRHGKRIATIRPAVMKPRFLL